MKIDGRCSGLALFLFFIAAASTLWAQGPPYQTDDPVPVDLHHYEFYIFGGMDGTHGGDRFHGSGLRVQLGRSSQGATARHSSLGRHLPVQQSRLSARRNGPQRLRSY